MDSNLLGSGAAISLLISFAFINFVLAFGTRGSRWIEDHTRMAINLVRIYYVFMGVAWCLMALRYWGDTPALVIGFNLFGLSGMIIFVLANYKFRNVSFGRKSTLIYIICFSLAIASYAYDHSFEGRTHTANIILTLLFLDLFRLYWNAAKNSSNRAYRLMCLLAVVSIMAFCGRSIVLIFSPDGAELAWHILNATAPALSLMFAIMLLLASIWETHYQLVHFAMYDDLTGVRNRRAFKEMFQAIEEQAKQKEETYGLVLVDLDFFKKINDSYGHDVGDFVLKEVAKLLQTSVRVDDKVSRIGGEEFSILLPGACKDTLEQMCVRLKDVVKSHEFKFDKHNMNITVSVGAGVFRGNLGFDQSFKLVDKALYAAKEERDCIRYAN